MPRVLSRSTMEPVQSLAVSVLERIMTIIRIKLDTPALAPRLGRNQDQHGQSTTALHLYIIVGNVVRDVTV